MKIINVISIQTISLVFLVSASAQGTFQNLNFEQANPIAAGGAYPSDYVTTASALPFWTVTIGGVQQTAIPENGASTGATQVSLLGPGYPTPALEGNYSVLLTGTASIAAISQTGLIPSGTQSLLFEAQQGFGGGASGNLNVTIAGQTVSAIPVAVEPTYTVFGANISAWAGNTEPLTFSALQTSSGLNNWTIDDISFSPNAVPEPSPFLLSGIAGFLLVSYRRFVAHRK